jgi:hypothetical protein
MFLRGFISWWYGGGWLTRVKMMKDRLKASADFFSVELLISTLFAPYRQISAGNVAGSLNDQIRAFFDKLLSCTIGVVIRIFMIIFGLIGMFLQALFGIIILAVWLVIPLLPAIGLIGLVIGWVPR